MAEARVVKRCYAKAKNLTKRIYNLLERVNLLQMYGLNLVLHVQK